MSQTFIDLSHTVADDKDLSKLPLTSLANLETVLVRAFGMA